MKKKPEAVKTYRDGREVCNLNCKAGHDEYDRRKRIMYDRQKGLCALCGLRLDKKWMQFDHEVPRGMGGAFRDDRLEIEVDGKMEPRNHVVHPLCNSEKGSRRNVDFFDVP